MERINQNLKITRIVLYCLTALLFLLQFFWKPALYLALIVLVVAVLCLAVNELYFYLYLKQTKENQAYKKTKKSTIGLFILYFGIAVILMTVLIKLLFN